MPQTELVTREHLQRLLVVGICVSALLLLSASIVPAVELYKFGVRALAQRGWMRHPV